MLNKHTKIQQIIRLHKQLEKNFESVDLDGSLTVRGEIFFENNWLTIW